MDKATFIEFAPPFYGVAIVDFLLNNTSEALLEEMSLHYSYYDESNDERRSILALDPVIQAALEWLERGEIVEVSKTYFAPKVVRLKDNSATTLSLLEFVYGDHPVVRDYLKFRGRTAWLDGALRSIYAEYVRLGLMPPDFAKTSREEEWAPIPLDRDEPELAKVVTTLDDVIQKVRSSNGLGSMDGGFQQFILGKLRAASETFKTADSVTRAYLRTFVGQPLSELTSRYGPSALGAVADVAKAAFKEWLRKKGVTFLDDILR